MKHPALFLALLIPFNMLFILLASAPPVFTQQTYPAFKTTASVRPVITATSSPTPTSTPRSTATPVPVSVITPRPVPAQTPFATVVPVPIVIAPPSTPQTDPFITQINNYRSSMGLSPVVQDSYTCSFAKIRAQEIATSFNHEGFNNRISNKTLPYPGYKLVTENLAMNSDPQAVVNQWINSPSHAAI